MKMTLENPLNIVVHGVLKEKTELANIHEMAVACDHWDYPEVSRSGP